MKTRCEQSYHNDGNAALVQILFQVSSLKNLKIWATFAKITKKNLGAQEHF